jgi:hypothetical protein
MEMDRAHLKETSWHHRKGCIRLESPRCWKERTTKENLEKDNRRANNRDRKDLERV